MGSRIEKKLLGQIGRASVDYNLIEPDDHIMVGVSGGKDSWALLYLLHQIKKRVPFDFSLVAVNLDQKQPNFPEHIIPEYCASRGWDYKIIERDTYSIVTEKIPEGKTYCSLCSRLRRGILYDAAVNMGATKIALGHHREDTIETLLLNILYAGQIKAMPPRLRSDDGRNVVIRPMIYCREADVAEFAVERRFPIIPCDLCGSQEGLYRQKIKSLLASLEADNANVKGNLLSALSNVVPSHLLDRDLRAQTGADEQTGTDEALAAIGGSCGLDALIQKMPERQPGA